GEWQLERWQLCASPLELEHALLRTAEHRTDRLPCGPSQSSRSDDPCERLVTAALGRARPPRAKLPNELTERGLELRRGRGAERADRCLVVPEMVPVFRPSLIDPNGGGLVTLPAAAWLASGYERWAAALTSRIPEAGARDAVAPLKLLEGVRVERHPG